MDARLGKYCPGRNARFAGKEQLQIERHIAACRGPFSKGVSKSTHPTASGPPRSSGDLGAGLQEEQLKADEKHVVVNGPPCFEEHSRKLPVPSCKHKNHCALKSGEPADRCEDNVVRQRSSVPAENRGSSFRRYASRFFVLGIRSRNKFGMTLKRGAKQEP